MDIGNINWRQVKKIRSSFHFLIEIYDLLDCSFCHTKKRDSPIHDPSCSS